MFTRTCSEIHFPYNSQYLFQYTLNTSDFNSLHGLITQFLHRVSKKLYEIVFARTSSNFQQFDNSWQKDGKEPKIIRDVLIFHLTWFASPRYHVKRKCSKLLRNAVIISTTFLKFASSVQ